MRALDTQAATTQHITWQVAHETLSRLARERAAADAEEGRWLLAAQRAAVHVHLGFSSFGDYIGRLFGYQPRSVQEKLRVAEALEDLPALADALSTGELHWSAVRELTRVALRETEGEWLEFARGKTLRQLEQVVAGKEPGAVPGSPSSPAVQRHVLRFEVAAETFALFRDALRSCSTFAPPAAQVGSKRVEGSYRSALTSSGWPTATPSTSQPSPSRAPDRQTTSSPTRTEPSATSRKVRAPT